MVDQRPADEFPQRGRLLGIDFGTRRIGVAVSDSGQEFASPLENYQRQSAEADDRFFTRVCREHLIVGLIVGLPVHMSGDEGQSAGAAREYGQHLRQLTGLPVRYWDERFTSARAEMLLREASLGPKKRKQKLDKVAAMLLLQSYLDAPDRTAEPIRLTE